MSNTRKVSGYRPLSSFPPASAGPKIHGDLPGWAGAVDVAKCTKDFELPPGAWEAGAAVPLMLPIEHATPVIAFGISFYAWAAAAPDVRRVYANAAAAKEPSP